MSVYAPYLDPGQPVTSVETATCRLYNGERFQDRSCSGRVVSEETDTSSPLLAVYGPEGRLLTTERLPAAGPAEMASELARAIVAAVSERGGLLPAEAIREVVDNLIHAGFAEVVVSVADGGHTLQVADQGPGIPHKEKALRPGFSTADRDAKRYIRGVGAGLGIARRALEELGGRLDIEDNLEHGAVVTLTVPAPPAAADEASRQPGESPQLSDRQLRLLLLVVELGPVGPSRLSTELGISSSTAYREMVFLDQMGLVSSDSGGRRTATAAGLALLERLL